MEVSVFDFASHMAGPVLSWGFQNRQEPESNHAQSTPAAFAKGERVLGEPAGDLKHWTSQIVHTDFFVNPRSTENWGKKKGKWTWQKNISLQSKPTSLQSLASGSACWSDEAKLKKTHLPVGSNLVSCGGLGWGSFACDCGVFCESRYSDPGITKIHSWLPN